MLLKLALGSRQPELCQHLENLALSAWGGKEFFFYKWEERISLQQHLHYPFLCEMENSHAPSEPSWCSQPTDGKARGSRWVADSCWAPSQLCLNTQGTFQFTQQGPGLLLVPVLVGLWSLKEKGSQLGLFMEQKQQKGPSQKPVFPRLRWGKRHALGTCGVETSPPLDAGRGLPRSPVGSIWLPAGASGEPGGGEGGWALEASAKVELGGEGVWEWGWKEWFWGGRSPHWQPQVSSLDFRRPHAVVLQAWPCCVKTVVLSHGEPGGWGSPAPWHLVAKSLTSLCVSRDGLPAASLRAAREGLGDPQEPGEA